jgi:paraquat-inducible protein B
MNGSQNNSEVAADLPKANVKKSGRYFSIVWTVPVIAAILAAYLVYGHLQQSGPKITISFKDGSGLRTGQTPIKYRGVQIGEVIEVELSQDHQAVLVLK